MAGNGEIAGPHCTQQVVVDLLLHPPKLGAGDAALCPFSTGKGEIWDCSHQCLLKHSAGAGYKGEKTNLR